MNKSIHQGLQDSLKNMDLDAVSNTSVNTADETERVIAEMLWIDNDIKKKTARKKQLEEQLYHVLTFTKQVQFKNPEMEQKYNIQSCSISLKNKTRQIPLKKSEECKFLAEFLLSTSTQPNIPEEQERATDLACKAMAYLANKRQRKVTASIEKKFAQRLKRKKPRPD